jgi:small subunit ribosomal protein S6
MRDYELILILHPDLDENAVSEVIKRVTGWISDAGGSVAKSDLWGKRQLAYPIRKQTQGQYVLFQASMAPKSGAALERNLRLTEPIMRYMLTSKA